MIKAAPTTPIKITCVNLLKSGKRQEHTFGIGEEQIASVGFAAPQNWLYEPNATLLKAGAFKWVAEEFGVLKLDVNTHLYTSHNLVDAFPGRIFSIEKVINYKAKELKNFLPQMKANLAVRNFPHSVAQIRKKTGLKEGGEHYIFACRGLGEKPILIVTKKYQGMIKLSTVHGRQTTCTGSINK